VKSDLIDIIEGVDLLIDNLDVLLELLVADLLEEEVAQAGLLVQVVDLVPDHLLVLVVLPHLDLEQSLDVLVQLHQLLDLTLGDACDRSVPLRVVLGIFLSGQLLCHSLGQRALHLVLSAHSEFFQLGSDFGVLSLTGVVLAVHLVDLVLQHLDLPV